MGLSREARRLNELEADIAKLQAHLIQKRRDLQVEIQELDVLRGTAGEEYWEAVKSGKLLAWNSQNVRDKWNELREILESIANKKQRVAPPENGLCLAEI